MIEIEQNFELSTILALPHLKKNAINTIVSYKGNNIDGIYINVLD